MTVQVTDVTPALTNMPTIVGDHVEWVPTCDDVSILYTVQLTVTDQCGLTDVCTFTMTVILPNTHLDTTWVPWAKVGRNSDDAPVLGFRIDCVGSGDFLESITVKSFIQKAYSIEKLSLYAETGGGKGLQVASDTKVGEIDLTSLSDPSFDSNDTLRFLLLHYALDPDSNLFYIALDAWTDSLSAAPSLYHGECLEVIIEPGRMVLFSGWTNPDTIYNRPDWAAGDPCITGFYPWISGCRYRLCFDTEGPQFDLHFSVPFQTCSTSMVDLGDSVRIWADNIDSDIKGDITIVDPNKLFLWSALKLKDPTYDTTILIPDIRNTTALPGIDADTGQWILCAWAVDSADNQDTTCLEHDDLPWKIDTRKPLIDSVQILLTFDANGDGQIGLNDCITIHGWGLSNPDWEVAKMWVDMSHFGQPSNVPMPDAENNNKHFWVTVCLDVPWAVDSMDSNYNQVLVWAEDNACNQDTLRKGTPLMVDLEPPEITDALYYYHRDLDTAYSCIGIGDSAKISADVSGISDLVSVTCDLVEAGISGPADQPLDSVGGGWYELLWEIGEPPIADGKDTNNTSPPPPDYDYTVLITVTDDVGNIATLRTNRLNRTLDTRRPRWIYPDSIQCFPIAGAMLTVWWDTSADENDAAYFYVYCDSGAGSFDWLVGGTWKGEQGSLPGGDDRIELWSSEPGQLRDGQYYSFKVQIEDDCGNLGEFGPVVGGFTDGTAPHVCIAMPDSGLTFGAWFPIKAVADSASHDVDNACLYYRLMDIDGLGTVGPWTECSGACNMYRFGDGDVFTDSVYCLEGSGYTGWVELFVVACDEVGNCQDTTLAFYDDACLVDDGVFRPGHFLFYWDESLPEVTLLDVNGYPSPQTSCGFDVERGVMNEVVFTVDGATAADSFEVLVWGPVDDSDNYRIFHEDNLTMPCTIWVSVDGWDEETQNLYINVKDYENDKTGNLTVPLCVPPPPLEHCIYISEPVEWQRIRCTGTSGQGCVTITAEKYNYAFCAEVTFNEVVFQWSPNGIDSWETIEDVIGDSSWSTCWDNTDLVQDGDTIYFRAIAHDEYYVADTSFMVKVFVDCQAPNVTLLMEPLYYTCSNETPKISCETLTLKAVVLDDTVDISKVNFYVKKHSDPDIYAYWSWIGSGVPAYYDNIWVFMYGDVDTLGANQFYDFRIEAIDQANQVMFDYDGDGNFDNSTFNSAVAFGAGMTVFLDCEAPQPAFSMVADPAVPIYNVNPSAELGGSDKAYVQAGNDITVEISVLPSEDTCEVMKVEYFLYIDGGWVHVGTSTDPLHYPLTFNPLDGLIPSLDGWWSGNLKAELYDNLGNSNDDIITLYILDVDPTQAVIVEPENGSFVWGDVTLQSKALNAYEICEVCYEYKAEEGDWQPVLNGCTTSSGDDWEVVWHTLNTIADGVYYLRAVATDCDNNVDLDPRTIQVTVSNTLPTITMLDPVPVDSNECPDGPIDTLLFIGGTVELYAQVGEDATPPDVPVERVDFYYKSIFGYPDTWTLIGTDFFAPQVYPLLYAVTWDASGVADGAYHLKATVTEANGRVGDSPYMEVHIDNTPPLTEIIALEYDGFRDETPNNTDITQGTVVEVEAIAFDSLSSAGASECYNSGMEYLQFYVRDCSGEAGAPLDIVWVVDASGSMDLEQEAIGALISQFVAGLGGFDYQLAVVGFDTLGFYPWANYHSVPMDADGHSDTPGAFTGDWTTDEATFNTMVTSVGLLGGKECGFSALMETNTHYTFRPGASKHFILVTDEDAKDFGLEATAIAYMIDNGITVHLIGDPLGGATPAEPHYSAYENMANQTGGMIFNIATSHWGALLAALGAGIAGGEQQEVCFMKPSTEDGHYFGYWNTSGLAIGEYCLFTVATDGVGNQYTSPQVLVRIRDWTPPLVTIAAFHDEYVFGVTADTDIRTVDFKYRPKAGGIFTGDEPWTSIGLSSLVATGIWKAKWEPTGLTNGTTYEVLAASKDSSGNALPEDSIPRVTIGVVNGVISTANTAYIDSIRFKAFDCNITDAVVKVLTDGTQPTMLTVYNTLKEVVTTELVSMERSTNTSTWFAGTFDATDINSGGTGNFYASLTSDLITYIEMNGIVVAKVFENIGTNGPIYGMDSTVVVSIPDGATDAENGLAILPSDLPISPYWQQQWIPIGNDKGEEAFIFMTSGCNYSFINGKWATITISYDETKVTIPEEGLSVGWWDGSKWVLDQDMYLPTVNTADNTITFYASVLHGVYCVLEIGGFNIAGPTVWPLCDTYSGIMPVFAAHITDRENGIDSSSINVKLSSYRGFSDVRIVENSDDDDTDGFSFDYNTVTGVMEVYWDTTNNPYPLPAGLNAVTITAMNNVGSFKSATTEFTVDATVPDVVWHPVWISGEKPAVTFIITDDESGVNKDAIWIDIYDADESDQPYEKDLLLPIYPDGVDEFWTDDTTLYVELTNPCDGQYLHVVIYDGSYDYEYHDYLDWSWRVYAGGVRDCVDNKASAEHLVFPIDRVSPQFSFVTSTYANPVKMLVTDPVDTVFHHTYKQGSGVDVNSFKITENGVEVTSFTFNSATNILTYTPTVSGPIEVVVTVMDMVGNEGGIEFNNGDEDAEGPVITWTSLTERPIRIRITDAMSGVDWSTLKFYEDGLLICEGLECTDEAVVIDATSGVIEYNQPAGRIHVEIEVKDNAGNLSDADFYTEEEHLAFMDPHNYPNPFDPRAGNSNTTIDLGLSKSAYVTVKIYDFAGEYVATIATNQFVSPKENLYWDGTSEGGTDVANGTYLCYIKAKDSNGSTKTAVIKITVLKRDK